MKASLAQLARRRMAALPPAGFQPERLQQAKVEFFEALINRNQRAAKAASEVMAQYERPRLRLSTADQARQDQRTPAARLSSTPPPALLLSPGDPRGVELSEQRLIGPTAPNRGLPDALLRINLAGLRGAGYEIPEIGQVGRSFGMPGGGFEMQFSYPIPAEFITVVRQ